MSLYCSQIGQDEFVDKTLGGKVGGTFLDVGCGHWERISNTCYLERYRGWRGVAIDLEPSYHDGWDSNRPMSKFLTIDATTAHYDTILDQNGMPAVIDYLSIDLEPPQLSLIALRRVMESCRRFRVITFETDFYRQKETRDPSRELLHSMGYRLAQGGHQDDFWVEIQNR